MAIKIPKIPGIPGGSNPFKVLEDALKQLLGIVKIVPGLLQVIPLTLKALLFLVVSLPKMIFSIISNIYKFINKATPNIFGIVVLFILIFFGLQILVRNLLGNGIIVPPMPLMFFVFFIIYSLVMNDSTEISLFQKIILKLFLKIFNNDITRDLFKFNVKVDPKHPEKSFIPILAWVQKNLLKILLTLLFLAIFLKMFIAKSWEYITVLSGRS